MSDSPCEKFKLLLQTIVVIALMFITTDAYADSKLDNCLSYKDQIESLLEQENVSKSYFYLAVCESGCKIKESPKGARGFFQLMPHTYKTYLPEGCSIEDIDDIKCNTLAAAKYIKHLKERFNHISMLVKAYNRGGTNLQKRGSTKEADNLSRCVLQYISNDDM